MEPFKITTVYADGTLEERDATPEEIAQREIDIATFEEERLAREQAIAESAAKRASALAKLKALGLDDEEIAAIIP